MKNISRVLLALLVCGSSVSAQSTKDRDGLVGAVHTLRLESYEISKTTGKEEPLYGATIDTYDIEGYKTQTEWFTSDGSLSRQTLLTYDAKNRITEEADYRGNGSLYEKTVYLYDNDNKTAEIDSYAQDGSLSQKIVFTFRPDSDLNLLAGLKADRRFFQERVWVEAAAYDSGGSLQLKYTAVDQDEKREITHTINDSTEGLKTSEVKMVFIYDVSGKVANQYYVANGVTLNEDVNGENDEQKRTPEYEFDSRGNWTKKVIYRGGETRVEHRTITYY